MVSDRNVKISWLDHGGSGGDLQKKSIHTENLSKNSIRTPLSYVHQIIRVTLIQIRKRAMV